MPPQTDLPTPPRSALRDAACITSGSGERVMSGLCRLLAVAVVDAPLGSSVQFTIRNLIVFRRFLLCLSASLAYASATGARRVIARAFTSDRPPWMIDRSNRGGRPVAVLSCGVIP